MACTRSRYQARLSLFPGGELKTLVSSACWPVLILSASARLRECWIAELCGCQTPYVAASHGLHRVRGSHHTSSAVLSRRCCINLHGGTRMAWLRLSAPWRLHPCAGSSVAHGCTASAPPSHTSPSSRSISPQRTSPRTSPKVRPKRHIMITQAMSLIFLRCRS